MPPKKQRVIMVMGVQRSGSSICFHSLAKARRFHSYNEAKVPSAENPFYLNHAMRPLPEIEADLKRLKGPVVFKPIGESVFRSAGQVLEEYSPKYNLSIVWIYRDPLWVYLSYAVRWPNRYRIDPQERWHISPALFARNWTRRNSKVIPVADDPRVSIVRYRELCERKGLFGKLCERIGVKGRNLMVEKPRKMILPDWVQAQLKEGTADMVDQLDKVRLSVSS